MKRLVLSGIVAGAVLSVAIDELIGWTPVGLVLAGMMRPRSQQAAPDLVGARSSQPFFARCGHAVACCGL